MQISKDYLRFFCRLMQLLPMAMLHFIYRFFGILKFFLGFYLKIFHKLPQWSMHKSALVFDWEVIWYRSQPIEKDFLRDVKKVNIKKKVMVKKG